MEKLEPLLKEKEDKFYFVKENKEKKVDKNKMKIIVTPVIGVIVLWLMWYTLYPFYVGFVHYDEGHNVVSEDKTEEEKDQLKKNGKNIKKKTRKKLHI